MYARERGENEREPRRTINGFELAHKFAYTERRSPEEREEGVTRKPPKFG